MRVCCVNILYRMHVVLEYMCVILGLKEKIKLLLRETLLLLIELLCV